MKEQFRRICAWCQREIGKDQKAIGPVVPKELQDKNTTHGMCKACYDEQMKNLPKFKEWLSRTQ